MNNKLEQYTVNREAQVHRIITTSKHHSSNVVYASRWKIILFERDHMNYYGSDKGSDDDFPFSPSQIEPRAFAPGSSGASSMDMETDSADDVQSSAASLTPPPSITGRLASLRADDAIHDPGMTAPKEPPSSAVAAKRSVAKKKTSPPAPGDTYTSKERPVSFPKEYRLKPYDVICGRNKFAFNQVGNRRFRIIVSLFLQRYFESTHRVDRHLINIEIIDTIKKAGGYFLKQEKSGEWGKLTVPPQDVRDESTYVVSSFSLLRLKAVSARK